MMIYDSITGPLPAPTMLMTSSPTPTSITLTWEQPEGADAVEGYEINYMYSIMQCVGEVEGDFPAISVMLNDGSLRSYTITNTSSTLVQEDSTYTITLRAVNSVTRSNTIESFPNSVITGVAGKSVGSLDFTITLACRLLPAPGAVQSLRTASVDVTNITIQWDRVDCRERNGPISSYLVFHFLTSTPSRRFVIVPGTDDSDRMFSVTGLPPRTSYTFQVEAFNPFFRDSAVVTSINISTTAPQSKILKIH